LKFKNKPLNLKTKQSTYRENRELKASQAKASVEVSKGRNLNVDFAFISSKKGGMKELEYLQTLSL